MTASRLRRILIAVPVVASFFMTTTSPARAGVTYTGAGFDTCSAPSVDTMHAWLTSPYRSLGIYIGGANRACGDGNLSASWVAAVENLGWRLAPLYVGLQAPCVDQPGLGTIDANPGTAATEGASAADDAAARARAFGISTGSPIYFDMEAYGMDSACVNVVQAFLSSWVGELHNQGYLAGAYGSSASTIHDQAFDPYPNALDEIWFATWNGKADTNGAPYLPSDMWVNHQRLHQYQGNVNETWGGVSLNIDQDFDDGALVGAPGCGLAQPSTNTPAWSCWNSFMPQPRGGIAGVPAVASWDPARLDVFQRGADNHLWHRWSTNSGGTFAKWEDLGAPPGGLTGSPAAVSWSSDRIDVFGRGGDSAMWHLWWDGVKWQGWDSQGGVARSSPAVSSWAPGRLDVQVVGTDNAMWHRWYDGTWHNWESRGGFCTADPAAVSWGPGRIDMFTLGSGTLYHQWFDGRSWSGWVQEVAGRWMSGVAAASWQPGRLDLLLESTATGNPMGHVWYTGSWFSEDQGGSLTSAPAAVSPSYRRIQTFVVGTDGNLYQKWYGI